MTSSSTESRGKLILTVNVQQPATAISVLDHSWRVVARGIGSISKELPPGLYKIEAHLSRDRWTGYVSLRGSSEIISVPSFRIKTAVPLTISNRTHEYHQLQFELARKRVDVDKGKGARILLIARNWSPFGTKSTNLPKVRLERWRGDCIADLGTHGAAEQTLDAIATCSVSVNPGTYVVSVETHLGRISRSVYAQFGWDTQIIVLQDFTTLETGLETSTVRPSVSVTQAMVRTIGQVAPEVYELTEVGQTALSDRRLAFGEDVFDRIAWRKFDSPILGLLAAHILLLAEDRELSGDSKNQLVRFDRNSFETILKNTADLLGASQPDVLALRTRSISFPPPIDAVASTPPIFLLSWELLLSASQTSYPGILPESLWRRVRGCTNLAPHFTWGRAESVFAAQSRATERHVVKSLTAAIVREAFVTNDTPTTTGNVKSFDTVKGYGFIVPDGRSSDVLVRISAVKQAGLTSLQEAQRVTFDIELDTDGHETAVNLSLGNRLASAPAMNRPSVYVDDLEVSVGVGVAATSPIEPDQRTFGAERAEDRATSRNTWEKPRPTDLASFAPRSALDQIMATASTPEEAALQVARQFGFPPTATPKLLVEEAFDRVRTQVQT